MQSVYSADPADSDIGLLLCESYSSAEMQSVYSTAPPDWATFLLVTSNSAALRTP